VNVVAPGKLVLTGAYAVMEGAPAIVVAVDRYAVARVEAPDDVDTRDLYDASGTKLGLGSSAAAMVATEAARAVAKGEDVRDAQVRGRIFRTARERHATAQQGGSGVDIAAAVHGGALRYTLDGKDASMQPVTLPASLVLATFWSGTSARTSDLRARVEALAIRARGAVFDDLHLASRQAAAAVQGGDAASFVRAARAFGQALAALGKAADAPIVPPAFAELASLAIAEDAAFLPSGAGGGDVGIWLGLSAPSAAFSARAQALSMRPLAIGLDAGGVRTVLPAS
jgi:phosphomevalonate kinase